MTLAQAQRLIEYRRLYYKGTFYAMAWPRTLEGRCAYLQALDLIHDTDSDSIPLGHNYRCPVHGRKYHQ